MSLLERVHSGRRYRPPRLLIYGTEGIGKSTIASQAANPIFIPTEDGLDQIECDSFPLARSFEDVLTYLTALAQEEHEYQTVVIDSADWLERLIFDYVCKQYGAKSIEKVDGGYGKGYTHSLTQWRQVIDALRYLREQNYLELEYTVIEGPCRGRKVWDRLCLNHPNELTQRIARGNLSAICHAVGVMQPRDSVELHNLPLVLTVKCKKRADTDEISNEVKGYAKRESADGSVTLRYLTGSDLTKLSVRFTQATDLVIIAEGVPIGEVVWTSAGTSYRALISGLDCDVLDVDGSVQFNYAAPVNIRSNLILRPGAVLDTGSGNAVLSVQGDIAAGEGPCTWLAGTGGLHFAGTGDQLLDVAGVEGALDPIFIVKPAGQLILQSDLSCASLDHQTGTLEPNGKTITTTGNCRIRPGAKLAESLDDSAWTVGGDLDWQGEDGDRLVLHGTSPWSLSALGEVTVRYTDVAFCDASGGNPINVLDGTSINRGNNLNWLFPPVQPFAVPAGCVQSSGALAGIPVVPTVVAGETFVASTEAGIPVVPTAVAGETFVAAAKKGVVHA